MAPVSVRTRLLWVLLAAVVPLAAAGCIGVAPARPQPEPPPAVGTALAGTGDAASATTLPTAVQPTPVPTPVPTAIAVSGAAALPAGRLVFGVAREGAETESLWQLASAAAPTPLHQAIKPGLWGCAGSEAPRCLAVTSGGGLLLLAPDDSAPAQLLPIPAGFALNAAGGAQSLSALSLAPNGSRAAIGEPGRTTVVELPSARPQASLLLTATASMAWSPDGQALALVSYTEAPQQALTLWRAGGSDPEVVAIMREIDYLAWSPDSDRLAFSGRPWLGPGNGETASSDVFVAYLPSGEVSNMSEIGLFNQDEPEPLAAWAPAWEADGLALRYLRGVSGDPDRQEVVRHPLASQRASSLWPVAEAGLLGVSESPDGRWQARVTAAEGRQVAQVRAAGEPWPQTPAIPVADLQAFRWVPAESVAGQQGLLLLQSQALRWYDAVTGQVTELATACATCNFTEVVWLPQ